MFPEFLSKRNIFFIFVKALTKVEKERVVLLTVRIEKNNILILFKDKYISVVELINQEIQL